jgi:ABC-type methionine transport system ATPase subunit
MTFIPSAHGFVNQAIFVQGDALLGAITVRETLAYALRLSNVVRPMNQRKIDELVNTTIVSLDLTSVEKKRIGNAVQRGISDAQKRRVTIGTGLVTCPKVRQLILDISLLNLQQTRSSFWMSRHPV